MKGETEALIVAAQDQCLRMRNYEMILWNLEDDNKSESVDHVMLGARH